jgi:hypothetical protein
MNTITTVESLDNFAERSANDWQMKLRLGILLNSLINLEVITGVEIDNVKEIAEYFELSVTIDKLSKISV